MYLMARREVELKSQHLPSFSRTVSNIEKPGINSHTNSKLTESVREPAYFSSHRAVHLVLSHHSFVSTLQGGMFTCEIKTHISISSRAEK